MGPKVLETVTLERRLRENMMIMEPICLMQPKKQNQGQEVSFNSN